MEEGRYYSTLSKGFIELLTSGFLGGLAHFAWCGFVYWCLPLFAFLPVLLSFQSAKGFMNHFIRKKADAKTNRIEGLNVKIMMLSSRA